MHGVLGSWTRVISPRAVNEAERQLQRLRQRDFAGRTGVQLTFPSLQAGSSFRVPQGTTQKRWQFSDALSLVAGRHQWKVGGQVQRVDADFDLGVFRDGRIELVEDFPAFDRNGDGRVNDDDLLFAVTLRSGKPDQDLVIPDADNVHLAGYVQDDWRVHPRLSLNLGVRYEIDTDVNNISRVDELNPIVVPFVKLPRQRDTNNWAPRVGFNWSTTDARTERSRRLRHLLRPGHAGDPVARARPRRPGAADRGPGRQCLLHRSGDRPGSAVRAHHLEPVHRLHPARRRRIRHQHHRFATAEPEGAADVDRHRAAAGTRQVVRVDVVHNHGTDFIIGRTVGTVFNPVVGGPDRVVNLESSAKPTTTACSWSSSGVSPAASAFRAAYTLSKAMNYANDDQIPFGSGPIDPNDLAREYGPAPNDQRHRLALSGVVESGRRVPAVRAVDAGVRRADGHPDAERTDREFRSCSATLAAGSSRRPTELNDFIRDLNASGGIDGELLPLVSADARFNDTFNSLDLRLSKTFPAGRRSASKAWPRCSTSST